jgi:hypothetical protein
MRIAALAVGVVLAGAGCGSDGPKPVTGPAGQAEIEEVSGASGDPVKGKARAKQAQPKDSSKTNVE